MLSSFAFKNFEGIQFRWSGSILEGVVAGEAVGSTDYFAALVPPRNMVLSPDPLEEYTTLTSEHKRGKLKI